MVRPTSIAELRKAATAAQTGPVRGTEGQDTARDREGVDWRRWRWPIGLAAAGVLVVGACSWLLIAWTHAKYTVSA